MHTRADDDPPARRVLLVEDELLLRVVVAEEMRAAGLTVIEASSADEAWSYLTAGGQADIVVSDIHMPGSLDGRLLATRLQARDPALPVILTSGNAGPVPLPHTALFIPKPYRIADLVAHTLNRLESAGPDAHQGPTLHCCGGT